MKQYKQILAAVDFSKYTPQAVDHALTLACELKAELIFMNVINQRDIDIIKLSFNVLKRVSENLSIEGLTQRLYNDREEKMVRLMDQVEHEDVSTRFIIRVGPPVQELLKVVSEEKVDMVVMGAKGKNTLEDTIIGSTALKMFRQCPVPLITIR